MKYKRFSNTNKVSSVLNKEKFKTKLYASKRFEGWYDDYKENYQFTMSYEEYKKKRRNKKLKR
mgnify:CR=1 FL=1